MRKDRGNREVNDITTRTTTDHGRRVIDPLAAASSSSSLGSSLSDAAHDAAILEPQQSAVRADDGMDPPKKSSTQSTTSSATTGINGVLDAMYASGVELGQEVRRARLSTNGIENIAISFVGGTSMPATESSVTRAEISQWSSSIASSPALLRRSLSLRPLFELMDHPSVHAAMVKRSTFGKDGTTKETDPQKNIQKLQKMQKILKRKKLLLENHLRWYMAKSESLGTALDVSSAARVKSEHQLRIMARTVQDWVEAVVREDTTSEGRSNVDSLDSIVRESSSGLRGKTTAARSDQIHATQEEEKGQEMLSYVMQYRRASTKFDTYCKLKCEKENDVVHLKNIMYGRVRMSSSSSSSSSGNSGQTAAPSGLSGDTMAKDITDSKFTLRRVKDRCLADCSNQKSNSVTTSRNLRTAEEIENNNVNGVGTAYDLSTEAFFAGVQGACTVCNGMIRTVVGGSLPMMGGGTFAEPR